MRFRCDVYCPESVQMKTAGLIKQKLIQQNRTFCSGINKPAKTYCVDPLQRLNLSYSKCTGCIVHKQSNCELLSTRTTVRREREGDTLFDHFIINLHVQVFGEGETASLPQCSSFSACQLHSWNISLWIRVDPSREEQPAIRFPLGQVWVTEA